MLSRRRLPFVLLGACLLLATGAAAAEGDAFTATSTPSHVKPSTSTLYTVALTNSATSTKPADRAKVGIPAGFAVNGTTLQATTSAAGSCVASAWIADGALIANGKINVKRPDGNPNQTNNRLCQGATLTVAFSATSSPTDGSYTWVTELLRGEEAFLISGSQPNVRVDGTAPVVTIQQKPSDPSGSQAASFTFAVSEQATISCKLDDGPFAPCTSPVEYANLSESEHSFTVRATDPAGNTGQNSYSWRVDAVAPTIAITQKPSELSNSTSASFAFTASEPATECKLDDAAFAACSSPVAYADLAQGPHTFTVRATDSVGTTDQDAYTWTIDSIPPTLAITAGKPSDPSNSRSATFAFTASEPTQCKLDDGAFAACTSPKGYSNLADGQHTFTVKATDAAGNSSQDGYTWMVDATPPTVAITGGKPANPTNSTSASFSFTASEPTQCKLDGGEYTACTSPATYSGLAEGAHTFRVKATDAAGNTAEDSYTWTVDTTAPTVAIVGGPAALSNSRSPAFTFTTTDPAQCRLDDGEFTTCISPKSYSNLSDGQHTFTVKATDVAGNTSQDAYGWTIDATPPTVSIATTGPSGLTTSRSAVFTFTASDSTQCKLDDGEFAPCSSPRGYDNLTDGPHSFTVRAIDAAANIALADRTWTVDATPPTVGITGDLPGNPTNLKNASFSFTSSEASTFHCRLDTATFDPEPCPSPKGYTVSDGLHTFVVRATDAAGNTAEASHTWEVDSAAPSVSIGNRPPSATKSRSATFTFDADSDAATTCKLDGSALEACDSPKAYSGLPDGSHTFTVVATDPAANTAEDVYTWTIDNAAPTVTIVQAPNSVSDVKSPTFAFSVSDGAIACKLDGGPASACVSPKTYTNLPDGDHVFTVSSTDAAGNIGQDGRSWRIETKLAVATLSDKPRNPSTSTSARFHFASRAGATFECSLDGGAFTACTSPKDYSGLAQGGHTFAVRAKDGAGTGPPSTYAWAIDSVGPAAAIGQGPGNPTNSRSATFAFSANEASSFVCELDGGGFGPCASPWSYQGLGDGVHTFIVRPTDALGNSGSAVSYSWQVDATPPETTLGSAPAAATTAAAATFTFSASEQASFQCKLDAETFAPCSSPRTHTGLTRTPHAFEVRAVDAAGNIDPTPAIHRWTVTRPVVRTRKAASALLAPAAGARVTRPPLLRWRRTPRASYYNVQLYRGSVKVLSAWPTATRLQLKARWRYLGRTRRLTAGRYRWLVWPGFGKPAQRRYGKSLGGSTFRVVSRARR